MSADTWPVHPAAELFPMLTGVELDELAIVDWRNAGNQSRLDF